MTTAIPLIHSVASNSAIPILQSLFLLPQYPMQVLWWDWRTRSSRATRFIGIYDIHVSSEEWALDHMQDILYTFPYETGGWPTFSKNFWTMNVPMWPYYGLASRIICTYSRPKICPPDYAAKSIIYSAICIASQISMRTNFIRHCRNATETSQPLVIHSSISFEWDIRNLARIFLWFHLFFQLSERLLLRLHSIRDQSVPFWANIRTESGHFQTAPKRNRR